MALPLPLPLPLTRCTPRAASVRVNPKPQPNPIPNLNPNLNPTPDQVYAKSGFGYFRGEPINFAPKSGEGPPAWLLKEGAFNMQVRRLG